MEGESDAEKPANLHRVNTLKGSANTKKPASVYTRSTLAGLRVAQP